MTGTNRFILLLWRQKRNTKQARAFSVLLFVCTVIPVSSNNIFSGAFKQQVTWLPRDVGDGTDGCPASAAPGMLEVIPRVCFAFQPLLKDRCSRCVCSRAVGTVEGARKTEGLLPPSSVCSWFWTVSGECQAEPGVVI